MDRPNSFQNTDRQSIGLREIVGEPVGARTAM